MEYQNIVSDHQRAERFGKLMMTDTSRPQRYRSSKEEQKNGEESDEGFEDIDLDKISEEQEEAIEDQIEEEYYQEDDELEGQNESERMKTCQIEEVTYEEVDLM